MDPLIKDNSFQHITYSIMSFNQNVSNLFLLSQGLTIRNLQVYRFTSCRFHVLSLNLNYRLITTFILKPWSTFKNRCLHILRNQYLEHEIFCFAKVKSIFNVFYLFNYLTLTSPCNMVGRFLRESLIPLRRV